MKTEELDIKNIFLEFKSELYEFLTLNRKLLGNDFPAIGGYEEYSIKFRGINEEDLLKKLGELGALILPEDLKKNG